MAVSTYDQAVTQYLASLRYESLRSTDMAYDLIEAIDALLVLLPSSASDQSSSQSFSIEMLVEKANLARTFIAASTPSASVRFFSVAGGFR